jgi:FAD/FMN-containing dehydrogenase
MPHSLLRPGSTPPSPETLARFARIVGPACAISNPDDMTPHLHEWRGRYHGRAALVLKPATVGEVSQIMALAFETRTAIVPQGGNTGLVGGQIPFETGNEVVLSLSRLNNIRAVDPVSNTITAEAGVTLAAAQAAAEAADRMLPLSLAAEGSCQIGGNLATNAGGVSVLAHGNARALTLGLEVVLADGRVWDGLRSLKKDNTGYSLRDIFVGSEGTLGIITAAVLKLGPRPSSQAVAFAGLSSLRDVARLFAMSLQSAGPALTAFELIPRIGLDFVLRHGPNCRDPLALPYPWCALIEISKTHAEGDADAAASAILERAFGEGVIGDAVLANSLSQAREFWKLRELLSEAQKQEGGSVKHDVSVAIANIPAFIERASKAVERLVPGARPVVFGHYGDGNIHYNVSQPLGADTAAFLNRWDEISEAVHAVVLEFDGSISAEHGVGRMKRDLLARIKSPVELDLMRRIKDALDPRGVLNPGKLL